MIQIVQTRMLSVVSLYYMAFFSIRMAMLGLTGGALVVYYKLDKVNPGNVNAFLSRISTAFALCIAGCFVLELASPLPSLAWATYTVLWFKAIVLLAAPFTIGGIAVSLTLTRSGFPIGITYGVWRRPARRRDRLPRLAGLADMDGRVVGHVHDSGLGRGRRLVLWPGRF
jgi:hypothetical protein